MDQKKIMADLQDVREVHRRFLRQHKKEILEEFSGEGDAETAFMAEMAYNIIDKMGQIDYMARYMAMPVTRKGFLGRDKDGAITLDGEALRPMQEVEVYTCSEEGKGIWVKAFVSLGDPPYLVGLGKNTRIEKMCARIREKY